MGSSIQQPPMNRRPNNGAIPQGWHSSIWFTIDYMPDVFNALMATVNTYYDS